jgi:hypothetical protein
MERRKVIKKNELKHRAIKKPVRSIIVANSKQATNKTRIKVKKKSELLLNFFDKPLLYKAFEDIAKEKEIPMSELVLGFAALGLKAFRGKDYLSV